MKKRIRLTESDLKNIIKESVNNILSELDWKTYANASKKRAQQADENPNKSELRKKSYDLASYANKKFNDEYIGDYKYDTLGDKMNGKKSAKFDAYINPMSSKMSYGTVRGWNKGNNEIFSTDKGVYHSGKGGLTTPRKHFRNNDVANAYSRANDELWDYEKGNYDYQKGKGWVKESVKKVLKEVQGWGTEPDDFVIVGGKIDPSKDYILAKISQNGGIWAMFVVEYTDDIPEVLNKIKEWTNDDEMFPDMSKYIEEVHRVMQEEGIGENEAQECVEDYLVPIWDYDFAVYAPYGMSSSKPMSGKEMQERINATAKDSWLKH